MLASQSVDNLGAIHVFWRKGSGPSLEEHEHPKGQMGGELHIHDGGFRMIYIIYYMMCTFFGFL